MATMRAAVFQGKGKIGIREVPRPVPSVGEALVRITLTTLCGTDVHILRGEHPARFEMAKRLGADAVLEMHRFRLDQIEEAYDLFAHQRDGVLQVAIAP